jgi:hypothetical protein
MVLAILSGLGSFLCPIPNIGHCEIAIVEDCTLLKSNLEAQPGPRRSAGQIGGVLLDRRPGETEGRLPWSWEGATNALGASFPTSDCAAGCSPQAARASQ